MERETGREFTLFRQETEQEVAPEEVQIVVHEGKIVKVGDPRDVRTYLEGERSRQGDIAVQEERGAILPALAEAHGHPFLYSVFELANPVFVSDVKSGEELLGEIKGTLPDREEGKYVAAMGWNTAKVRHLSKDDLDGISTKHKIVVFDASFHGLVMNTPALREIEAMADRVRAEDPHSPLKGELHRDGRGTEEFSLLAMEAIEAEQSVEKITEGVERNIQELLQKGVTAVHDLELPTQTEFLAYLALRKRWQEHHGEVEFPITRVYLGSRVMERILPKLEAFEQQGILSRSDLPFLGLKLFADGSFGSHTAHLSEQYADEETTGLVYHKLEEMKRAADLIAKHGLNQLAIHAIGDKGIHQAVELAEHWVRLAEQGKFDPSKMRIEHFELPTPLDKVLPKTKNLGIWVTPQPNFLLDYVYEDRLGERVKLLCPHQKILDYKVPMMFGTDGMPNSMLYAVWSATHAPEAKQRLKFEDALFAATQAVGQYEGNLRGTLKEGAPADIIVADPAILGKLQEGERSREEWKTGEFAEGTKEDLIASLEGDIRKVYKAGRLMASR